jgi:putative oxidoreductase
MRPVRSAARAMLASIFVVGGARGLVNPDPLVPAAKRVTDRLGPTLNKISPRLPTDPHTLVQLDQVAKVAGGLLMLTRFHRPAALLLAGTLIPTSIAGHPSWRYEDPAQRRQQETQLLKNLGLFGGLLLAASDTEGRPGLRWRARRAIKGSKRAMRAADLGWHLPG